MPPKPRFTREEVIDAAYALLEQGGMEAVVAREVARRLGCTVAPIFTCFSGMEELRAAVHERALAEFAAYMRDCVDYFPAFKEFGLRWLRLAREHPQVYREIFLGRAEEPGGFYHAELRQLLAPILAEVAATFSVPAQDAEQLMQDMLIFAHGLATLGIGGLGEEELRRALNRLCISLVAGIQARNGCLNEAQLQMMLTHGDMVPRRKSGAGPRRE